MAQPEARLRARCRMWLDQFLPSPGTFTAIEHGRAHSGTPAQRAREWQRLKAQGVKTGLSDIMIWYRGRFIGVELKAGTNTASAAQEDFGRAMIANGFQWSVVRSVEGLATVLHQHGVPLSLTAPHVASGYDRELATAEPVKKSRRPAAPQKAKAEPAKLAVMARARARGVFG